MNDLSKYKLITSFQNHPFLFKLMDKSSGMEIKRSRMTKELALEKNSMLSGTPFIWKRL